MEPVAILALINAVIPLAQKALPVLEALGTMIAGWFRSEQSKPEDPTGELRARLTDAAIREALWRWTGQAPDPERVVELRELLCIALQPDKLREYLEGRET